MKRFNLAFAITLLIMVFPSCEKDEPVIPNEEELITTLNFTLTPAGGGTTVVLGFQDLDGDGGNAPIITGGTLNANQIYSGSLELLNEQVSPLENITTEIAAEAENHQFFFQTTVSGLTIAYSDEDANGDPLGLSTSITTSNAGSGTITVILRHEPDKSAGGVSNGDLLNAGGETDIEVSFPVDVQ